MDNQATLWEIKRDNNKREMIRAARNLFEKKGYHNTSLKELCSEVMISKTTFFNYFGSKDALIKIIFESAFIDTKEDVEKQYPLDAEPKAYNPIKAIEDILLEMLRDVTAYPVVTSTAYELMLGSNSLKSVKEGYENLIKSYIKRAKSEGCMRDDLTEEVACTILTGTFYSLTFASDIKGQNAKLEETVNAVLSVIK